MRSAIILCGGKATRMGELCKEIPKILMKVGTKTILDHQISLLRKASVQRIILAVGHLKEILKEEVGNKRDEIEIVYSDEVIPLGTAGAFKNAFKYLDDDESCFGLNGDIVMPSFDPSKLEQFADPTASMVVTTTEWKIPYGMVEPKTGVDFGLVEKFVEKKPVLINAGFYLIKPKARDLFPDRGSIETDVFEKIDDCGYFKYAKDDWYDIGTPQTLEKANEAV